MFAKATLTVAIAGCAATTGPLSRQRLLDEGDEICQAANNQIAAAQSNSTPRQLFRIYAESAQSIAELAANNGLDDIRILMARAEQAATFEGEAPTSLEALKLQAVATEVRAAGFEVCGW